MLIIPFSSAASIFEDFLSPFGFVNMEHIYHNYAGLIDLIVYAMLFIGLSEATIGKRFESRGGKAVVAAIGISLAVGLSITSRKLGFSLASFGPLAASIFIFFVGFIIFLGIKSFKTGAVPAGALALVFTYFSMRAVTPGFFDWMISNPAMSWIHSLILVACLISIYQLIKWILPKSDKGPKRTFFGKEKFKPEEELALFRKLKTDEEGEHIEDQMTRELAVLFNETDDILTLLKRMRNATESREWDQTLIIQMLAVLSRIHELLNQENESFKRLSEQIQRIKRLDLRSFYEIKRVLHTLNDTRRKQIKYQLKQAWHKLGFESRFVEIKTGSEILARQFAKSLDALKTALDERDKDLVRKWLDIGLTLEKKQLKLNGKARAILKEVDAFTARDLNELTQEFKQSA
jgi:hypothetical protein